MRRLIVFLLAAPMFAADYYVDNSCQYNGTGAASSCAAGAGQAGAFNSVANMKNKTNGYAAGDVIMLKCGQMYNESTTAPTNWTGAEGNPITMTRWGTCTGANDPILNGSVAVTGFSVYSGTTYSATFTKAVTPASVFAGPDRLTKGTGKDALNNLEWWWETNTLYIRNDSASPDTMSIEVTSLGSLWTAPQKNYITYDHLQFRRSDGTAFIASGSAGTNGLKLTNVTFIQTHQAAALTSPINSEISNLMVRGSYSTSGGIAVSGTVASSLTIKNFVCVDCKYPLIDSNSNAATVVTINGCLFDRYKSPAVQLTSASTIAVTNCVTNGSGEDPENNVFKASAGTMTVDYSAVLPDGTDTTIAATSGVTVGTNIVALDPQYTATARRGFYTASVDDTMNLSTWQMLNDVWNSYGYTTTHAVSTQVSPDWSALQTEVNAGNEIASHTRTHAKLSETDAIAVQYVGGGSAATMTVGGNTLSTTVTGAPDDMSLDLTASSYDTITELCAYIDGLAAYTCTPADYSGGTASTSIAAISGQDIRTATYTALFDQAAYLTYELTGSKSDLSSNLTNPGGGAYTVKTIIWPGAAGGGTYNDTTIDAAIADGYLIGRSFTVPTSGNWRTDNLSLYSLATSGSERGMQYHLAFEKNCNDSINANHFTCSNVTYTNTGAYWLYAANLNGTTSSMSRADGTYSNLSNGDFLLRWQVKPTAISGKQTLYFQRTDADNYMWVYITEAGAVRLSIYASGSEALGLETAAGAVTGGSWQEIIVIGHAKDYRIMVGGTTLARTTTSVKPADYTGSVYIGASYIDGSTANFYGGLMDHALLTSNAYRNTQALMGALASWGGVVVGYGHGEPQHPAAAYWPVLDAVKAYTGAVTVANMGSIASYLLARGTLTGQTFRWNQGDAANYRPRMTSPLCGAGTTQNATDMDGLPYLRNDIGPYRCVPKTAFAGVM